MYLGESEDRVPDTLRLDASTNQQFSELSLRVHVPNNQVLGLLVLVIIVHILGGCQNYGPFLGTLNIRGPYYNRDPKRDHNFDNHPFWVSI